MINITHHTDNLMDVLNNKATRIALQGDGIHYYYEDRDTIQVQAGWTINTGTQ